MDFKELSDLLGGCVFPDHLGFDPNRVQQELQRYEAKTTAHSTHNHEAFAGLHLGRAIVAMRTGDFAGSRNCLAEIAALDLPPRWQNRQKAYSYMSCCLRRYPSAIRFRPDNKEVFSTISDAVDDLLQANASMRSIVASTQDSLLDRVELQCIKKATGGFNDDLRVQAILNPEHPEKEQREMILKFQSMQGLTFGKTFDDSLLAQLRSLKLEATARYFECLELEVLRVTASPDLGKSLESYEQECSSLHDVPGFISALIQRGDQQCSPPMTSPIAYNLVTEGALSGYEIQLWDRPDFESQHRLRRTAQADLFYDKASRLAQEMQCQRGIGMISLRRACFLHLEAILEIGSKRMSKAMRNLTAARAELTQASTHFAFDQTQQAITQAHFALLSITEGDHKQALQTSTAIGTSCKNLDNCQVCRFVGTLMLRFGRRQWLDSNRTDTFLMCLSCARACHDAADDTLGQYQVEIARAKLLCEVGSINPAQSALQQARVLLQTVLQQLKDLQLSREEYRDTLMCSKAAIETYFEGVENSIRLKSANPVAPEPKVNLSGLASYLPDKAIEDIQNAANRLAQLAADFSHAVTAARANLVSADQEAYVSSIEGFLHHLEQSDDLQDLAVAGYHVRTLCLLGRYDEARAILPTAVPLRLGGQGKDILFGKAKAVDAFGVSRGVNAELDECKRCIGHAVWAKDWYSGAHLLAATRQQCPQFLADLTTTVGKEIDWQTQTDVAAIYEHNDGLSEALFWYLRARAALEKSRLQAPAMEARQRAMDSMNSSALFAGLMRVCLRFACMVKLGLSTTMPTNFGMQGKDWEYQALDFAEQNRARALLDILSLSANDREAFAKEMAGAYALRHQEDLAWNRGPTNTHKLNTNPAIDASREEKSSSKSLFSAVLYPVSLEVASVNLNFLRDCLPDDGLALHYNVTDDGTKIFALSKRGLLRVGHSSLDRKGLRDLILAYQREAKQAAKAATRAVSCAWGGRETSLLARYLLSPVSDLVATKHHIIFVPGHELSAFPLSVLPFEDEPLIMRKCVSQVPSLNTLRQLVRSNFARTSIAPSILVSQDRSIPMTSVAGAMISDALSTKVLSLNTMTVDMFGDHFGQAGLVHIGTHGLEASDGKSPWQAHVQFRPAKKKNDPWHTPGSAVYQPKDTVFGDEGVLRVMHLAHMRTAAAVIVFSACLSAKGEITQGNDMVGFSHALLQSGAQSYIGALWKVSDFTTMLMMTLLYRELDAGQYTTSIAECLRRAQIQFYKMTTERAMSIVREAEVCWVRFYAETSEEREKQWAKYCRNALQQASQQLDVVDFKDPYHWAAWVVVGNGDVQLYHQLHHDKTAEQERAPSLPARPADLVPLHQIHSIDAAGISTARPPSISVTTPPAPNTEADTTSEETPPPLPPRRASEPVSSPLRSNQTGSVARRPVPRPPSRPSSAIRFPADRPAPTMSMQQMQVQPHPGRASNSQQQYLQRQRQTPGPTMSPSRRPQDLHQGQSIAPVSNRRPPPNPAAQTGRTNTTVMASPQESHRPNPQTYHLMQSQQGSRTPPHKVGGTSPGQRSPLNRSANASPDPQSRPRSGGRIRRLMQHPGSKIAVRLGTGLLVGGALGAQVGGIMDQWSGAAGAGGSATAFGGGGGLGLGLLGDEDDYDDGGEGEGVGEYDGGYGGDEAGYGDVWDQEGGAGMYEDDMTAGYEEETYITGDVTSQEQQATAETTDAGTGYYSEQQGSTCIEDDPMYSSMMPNGGYTM